MATRKNIKDIWNAFMLEGATFSEHGIPNCPTTSDIIPSDIVTWSEALDIYHKNIKSKNYNFKYKAFICFYEDDQNFDSRTDSKRSIWNNYKFALKVIKHFEGVITPDFSTYDDFPDPVKRINTYRMRAFGYWLTTKGIRVINNLRWGIVDTYEYSYDGIARYSIIAIGTVGGSPRKLVDRARFELGLKEAIKRLSPHTIIIYGSANYRCIQELKAQGIKIISFSGRTAKAFERRKAHE